MTRLHVSRAAKWSTWMQPWRTLDAEANHWRRRRAGLPSPDSHEQRRGLARLDSGVHLLRGHCARHHDVALAAASRSAASSNTSTSTFGDRNWAFDTAIEPRSQIHPLAQAFRRMAARIDGLIRSHKDMSNAMSHEIKTPLARMRFEVEVARTATYPRKDRRSISNNINTDITELNAFVTATLDYAILERAEVALNLSEHDFTPFCLLSRMRFVAAARTTLDLRCEVDPAATHVRCDAHLMETVLRNLLYNALRYAKREVRGAVRDHHGCVTRLAWRTTARAFPKQIASGCSNRSCSSISRNTTQGRLRSRPCDRQARRRMAWR